MGALILSGQRLNTYGAADQVSVDHLAVMPSQVVQPGDGCGLPGLPRHRLTPVR